MNEEYGGFEYSCWAKRLPNGAFTPMIAITKYYAIRKQTLKKLFFLDERYKTAPCLNRSPKGRKRFSYTPTSPSAPKSMYEQLASPTARAALR